MPALYETIVVVIVFLGSLGFIAVAKPDATTTAAIIGFVGLTLGSFVRGMSPSGNSVPAAQPTVTPPATVPAAKPTAGA